MGSQHKLGEEILKSSAPRCELSMKSDPAAQPDAPENVFLWGLLGPSQHSGSLVGKEGAIQNLPTQCHDA